MTEIALQDTMIIAVCFFIMTAMGNYKTYKNCIKHAMALSIFTLVLSLLSWIFDHPYTFGWVRHTVIILSAYLAGSMLGVYVRNRYTRQQSHYTLPDGHSTNIQTYKSIQGDIYHVLRCMDEAGKEYLSIKSANLEELKAKRNKMMGDK